MKVKTYTVVDMAEAMQLIRVELGPEAYIVSQRKVRKGLFKKRIEVKAAVAHGHQAAMQSHYSPRNDLLTKEELLGILSANVNNSNPKEIQAVEVSSESLEKETLNKGVVEEIQSLKEMVVELSKAKEETKEVLVEKVIETVYVENHDKVAELLSNYDFSQKFNRNFEKYLKDSSIKFEDVNSSHLEEYVEQIVEEKVNVSINENAKIQVFVGPPGVGKTTTIAKVAALAAMKFRKKVGFITVDTFRIGAVQQLKIYSNILQIPIKVVYSAEDMKQALVDLSDCDLVIVDSIGRSHRDNEHLDELHELIGSLNADNTFLVLNMSTKYRELNKIMDKFEMMNYDHLILTKLDENERNENIVNICMDYDYPISYLCSGQEVPDDIEEATKSRVLELVLGGDGK